MTFSQRYLSRGHWSSSPGVVRVARVSLLPGDQSGVAIQSELTSADATSIGSLSGLGLSCGDCGLDLGLGLSPFILSASSVTSPAHGDADVPSQENEKPVTSPAHGDADVLSQKKPKECHGDAASSDTSTCHGDDAVLSQEEQNVRVVAGWDSASIPTGKYVAAGKGVGRVNSVPLTSGVGFGKLDRDGDPSCSPQLLSDGLGQPQTGQRDDESCSPQFLSDGLGQPQIGRRGDESCPLESVPMSQFHLPDVVCEECIQQLNPGRRDDESCSPQLLSDGLGQPQTGRRDDESCSPQLLSDGVGTLQTGRRDDESCPLESVTMSQFHLPDEDCEECFRLLNPGRRDDKSCSPQLLSDGVGQPQTGRRDANKPANTLDRPDFAASAAETLCLLDTNFTQKDKISRIQGSRYRPDLKFWEILQGNNVLPFLQFGKVVTRGGLKVDYDNVSTLPHFVVSKMPSDEVPQSGMQSAVHVKTSFPGHHMYKPSHGPTFSAIKPKALSNPYTKTGSSEQHRGVVSTNLHTMTNVSSATPSPLLAAQHPTHRTPPTEAQIERMINNRAIALLRRKQSDSCPPTEAQIQRMKKNRATALRLRKQSASRQMEANQLNPLFCQEIKQYPNSKFEKLGGVIRKRHPNSVDDHVEDAKKYYVVTQRAKRLSLGKK